MPLVLLKPHVTEVLRSCLSKDSGTLLLPQTTWWRALTLVLAKGTAQACWRVRQLPMRPKLLVMKARYVHGSTC